MNRNLIHIRTNRKKSVLSIERNVEKNEFTYGKLLLGHPVINLVTIYFRKVTKILVTLKR